MTPSITTVPDTRDWSFQTWGGNSGLAARCSSARNATSRTAERVSAVTVWTDHQPWVSVPETPYTRVARPR